MRRPELMFALVLLGSAGVATADPADLKPFKANYSAEWKGVTAATSTLELRHGSGETYVYESVNKPLGMFRLALPDSLTQISTFRLSDGQIVPVEFRGSDEKERPVDLKFDWNARRVTGKAKDHAVDVEIPVGVQDPLSLQIASLRHLAKGSLQSTVALIDGDGKLKEYEMRQEGKTDIETALGTLDTIVYTSRRSGSDRMTRTWVAPALGYLPVKAERIRKGKVEFTLRIESVDK
jgi:hypothetical protein